MFRFADAWKVHWLTVCMLGVVLPMCRADEPTNYSVGVAQVDITPDYPVRLSGFGFRRTESEGVTLPIWAKAMAISGAANGETVVVVTVDNLGIPASVCDEVAKRLAKVAGLKRSQLAITATHTHTGPMLRGVAPTLFGGPIPDEQWARIDRYTAELTDKLEQVALAALKDRQPARLTWGIGSVKFAVNRRTKDGPVDHDLPVLAVKSLDGKLRAVYVNYACHCVTLSDNKISGDWAGYAQDMIQRTYPSAIAMVSIGCGADQNPSSGVTGDKAFICQAQGANVAVEVARLLGEFLAPVSGDITTSMNAITLDFVEPPTRAEWEERSEKTDAAGYHARVQLERLDRGESLQSKLDYSITSWTFGDSLAMVFLPGEVVVDYALRLKKELDGRRLWINAYANDAPCYIPSERVLSEGGYEAVGAMINYDRPGPLKAGLEAQIIGTVCQQLDAKFASPFDANKTQGSLPKSPQQSLAMLQTTPNLRVDLVVAEPLIQDPVAIDFGLDGALWVAEMHDYPTGLQKRDEKKEGTKNREAGSLPYEDEFVLGRIRLVRDRDGDGQFDSSTIFLDKIPFPTGVTVWRNGVLVCSAPDILFAEDTDGDDKADVVKKLFTGFGTTNLQARVNSLCYGLDGWVHGSCGLFGGTITNFKGQAFELGDRDFRMKPETGEFEAATGRTQHGRVRDDFGNWFGCDNTNLAFHYPLAEHYLKRNPYIASPPSRVNLVQTDEARQLFPARADAQRFQLSGPPGTVTAACGIGVYRDSRLGPEYTGNLFVCEPVNLLVHRMTLKPSGSSFIAERPANERQTEFLRSTDGWFRPVQAVTGPDGGLWVVDMYRFIIEDPRWIPEHELTPLDVRAGSSLGRIYRVRNADEHSPPATRSVRAGGNSNSVNRDTHESSVSRELRIQQTAIRADLVGVSNPEQIHKSQIPESRWSDPIWRMNYYRQRDAGGTLADEDVLGAIEDSHPGIRRYGLTLAERQLSKNALPPSIIRVATDEDAHVRLQAACTLGVWPGAESGAALAKMVLKDADDPYLVAAAFSSVGPRNLESFTTTLFRELAGREPPSSIMPLFLATAVGYHDEKAIKLALKAFPVHGDEPPKAWHLDAVANLVESMSRGIKSEIKDEDVRKVIREMQIEADIITDSDRFDEETRLAAINLLGRSPTRLEGDTQRLGQLLSALHPPLVRIAAIEALERIGSESVPPVMAAHFRELSPVAQSRAIDALLSRELWIRQLFAEIVRGTIPMSAVNVAQRQELVAHPDAAVQERAVALFATDFNSDRQQVVKQYRESFALKGDIERGRANFSKSCSQCHKLGDTGYAVGPDLAMVANKTPSFLLQEILDPNRNVDSRYTTYIAETKSGLIRTGILSSESSTSVTLLGAEGKQFTLLRQDLSDLRASGKSLMPEGLDKDLSHQAMADLIAFLGTIAASSRRFDGNVPSVVISDVARRILDDQLSEKSREALIADHPADAAELVVSMTTDLTNDADEEYRRIPWIWRVAVACGKRDQADPIRSLLNVSLPKLDQPLRDWQAVVIGGGVINGIGLSGGWPRSRIDEILRDEADLKRRWQSLLVQAAHMADDDKIPNGTRYDALRIVALGDGKSCLEQLVKYLAKGVDAELQMGAISGLSDRDSTEIPPLLLDNMSHFDDENRGLAIHALTRTDGRIEALLDAVADGRIQKSHVSAAQRKKLRESKNPSIKARAKLLLGTGD